MLVPMGNSLNRVLDLVVRLGYSTVVFAGCDGLAGPELIPTPGQIPSQSPLGVARAVRHGGRWLHPSQTSGLAHWNMTLDEYALGFLGHNRVRAFSLTPSPLGHPVTQQESFKFCGGCRTQRPADREACARK